MPTERMGTMFHCASRDFDQHRIAFFGLLGLVLFTICGGPYGIEEIFSACGIRWGFLLLIGFAFLWAGPVAMMSAELTSRLPRQGGDYIWVSRTLGPFWGVQLTIWTISYALIDLTLYPALMANYLESLRSGVGYHSLAWALLAAAAVLNLLSIRISAGFSVISAIMIWGIFLLLFVFALDHSAIANPRATFGMGHKLSVDSMVLAGSVALWSFSGWENVAIYAGEVKRAANTFPSALVKGWALVTGIYLCAVAFVWIAGASWESPFVWGDAATRLGHPWLAKAVLMGGMVSLFLLLNNQILYVCRLPDVLARDGWLPSLFYYKNRFGSPVLANLLITCTAGLLLAFSFQKLVVFEIIVYAAAFLLQSIALFRLRAIQERSTFVIPFNGVKLAAFIAFPLFILLALFIGAIRGSDSVLNVLVLICVMCFGLIVYFGSKNKPKRKENRNG